MLYGIIVAFLLASFSYGFFFIGEKIGDLLFYHFNIKKVESEDKKE